MSQIYKNEAIHFYITLLFNPKKEKGRNKKNKNRN